MTNPPTPQGVTPWQERMPAGLGDGMYLHEQREAMLAEIRDLRTALSHPTAPEQPSGERKPFQAMAQGATDYTVPVDNINGMMTIMATTEAVYITRDQAATFFGFAATPIAEPAGETAQKGWKLVPVEPTQYMLDRGHHQIDFDRSGQNTCNLVDESHLEAEGVGSTIEQDMRDCWAAMLAASPSAPSLAKTKPHFENTYCSQCGGEFGPGDAGFSHCEDHAASPAAPEAAKPEQQAQAGGPPAIWLARDGAHQLFIVNGGGPHDIYGGEQYITLQAHREVMEKQKAKYEICFAQLLEAWQAITKKDAALRVCVEALWKCKDAMDELQYSNSTHVSGIKHADALADADAAITQAQEALK